MTWDDVWMIIGAVIMSCGGAGVIIVGASSFLANMIEKRLEMKYSQLLNKELEKYKSSLESRRYITKAQFDREYEIYGKLSMAFTTVRYELSAISFKHFYTKKDLKEILVASLQSVYERSLGCMTDTQNLLYENAAFMPEDIYSRYMKLYDLATDHFLRFKEVHDANTAGRTDIENLWSMEDEHRYVQFTREFDELNKVLREYLESLSVCE